MTINVLYFYRRKQERGIAMEEMQHMPAAWQDFLSGQRFSPAIVKSLERIHDRTWEMKPNRHSHFEMVYIKKGCVNYQIEGKNVILNPCDLILIKPDTLHVVKVESDEMCELFVLSFAFENHSNAAKQPDFMDFLEDSQTRSYIHLSLTRKNEITAIFDRIVRERQKAREWDHVMVNLLMMELFVLLSRAVREEWEQNGRNRSLKMKELLLAARDYIDRNYNKNITLSDVAQYIYLSESYLAHSFKQEFGISPKSYLLQVRIRAAKDFLENTQMKIGDIALMVGFSGQQRFNDIFKKQEHMTPLKYRKQSRLTHLNQER